MQNKNQRKKQDRIQSILKSYEQGKITVEEANAKLESAGSLLKVQPEPKAGNALLDCHVGSPEPCMVQDGKLVNAVGYPYRDRVFYQDIWYTVGNDGVTLEEIETSNQ